MATRSDRQGSLQRQVRGIERRVSAIELITRQQAAVARDNSERITKVEKDVKAMQEDDPDS